MDINQKDSPYDKEYVDRICKTLRTMRNEIEANFYRDMSKEWDDFKL